MGESISFLSQVVVHLDEKHLLRQETNTLAASLLSQAICMAIMSEMYVDDLVVRDKDRAQHLAHKEQI